MYKSKLEQDFAKKLKRMTSKSKLKVAYESDVIPYTVVLHRNYHPDFTITFPDGHKRFIEVKGYLRPEDRQKMKFVRDQHPDMDIRIVFAKDNKLNSKSNTMYSTWAKKNRYPYAIGTIPDGWRLRDG